MRNEHTLARTWDLFLCTYEKLVATKERQKRESLNFWLCCFCLLLLDNYKQRWTFGDVFLITISKHGEPAHLPNRKCCCHVIRSRWLVMPHLYTSFSLISGWKVVSQLYHFIFTTEWGEQLRKSLNLTLLVYLTGIMALLRGNVKQIFLSASG